MCKWTELIGLPVISQDGVEVGCVKGLVMNAEHTHVSSLLLEVDNSTRKARVIRINDIHSIQPNEVRLDSPELVQALDLAPDIRLVLYPHGPVSPTRLHTHDGVILGDVRDLSFDVQTGRIVLLEVAKEGWEEKSFEPAQLPLHEELRDGVVTHASVLREPQSVPFEYAEKPACSS